MRKILLTIALCAISFAGGTFLTSSKAARVTEDPDFEINVTAGYVTIDAQTGTNYLYVDNSSESSGLDATLSLITQNAGLYQNIENGRQYKLLLVPLEER
jgi:hypothetical protein